MQRVHYPITANNSPMIEPVLWVFMYSNDAPLENVNTSIPTMAIIPQHPRKKSLLILVRYELRIDDIGDVKYLIWL